MKLMFDVKFSWLIRYIYSSVNKLVTNYKKHKHVSHSHVFFIIYYCIQIKYEALLNSIYLPV